MPGNDDQVNPFDPPRETTSTETSPSTMFRLRTTIRILSGVLLFGPIIIAILMGLLSVLIYMLRERL